MGTMTTAALLVVMVCAFFGSAAGLCSGTNYGDSRDYQCDDFFVMWKDQTVDIQCYHLFTNFSATLPQINIAIVKHLRIKYCGLPATSLKEVLDRMNITTVKVLQIKTIGDGLSTRMFEGLELLEELDISECENSTVRDNFLEAVPQLKSLTMTRCPLKNINKLNFSVLPSLEELQLSEKTLNGLAPNWFANLTGLRNLWLFNNNITSLHKNAFAGLSSLGMLELSHNKMKFIDPRAFRPLPRLANLSLKFNELLHLNETLFDGNKQMTKIAASYNPGLKFGSALFNNLPQLNSLDLANCSLSELPPTMFEGTHNIVTLTLRNNSLETVPEGLLNGLGKLSLLDISRNNLKELSEGSFATLSGLKDLDLSVNRLKRLTNGVFNDLSRLNTLNIRSNKLETIGEGSFNKLDQLTSLDLAQNVLTSNMNNVLTRNIRLKFLDVSYNRLTEWNDAFESPSTVIKKINVSHNQITKLSLLSMLQGQFSSNFELDFKYNNITYVDAYLPLTNDTDRQLLKVDLRNNKLSCDCFNHKLIRHLQGKDDLNNQINILFMDELQCSTPGYEHLKLKQVPSDILSCPLSMVAPSNSYSCNETCACFWKPENSVFLMNCSNSSMSSVPRFRAPQVVQVKSTYDYVRTINVQSVEVVLSFNKLKQAPGALDGYDNVQNLDLSNNFIGQVDWLPHNLSVLRLDHNKIGRFSDEIIHQLNETVRKVYLDNNPWICDCEASHLQRYLQENLASINSTDQIRCADSGRRIFEIVDMCKSHKIAILWGSVVVVILFFFFATFAALYYKYQETIKVWLYTKNLCLWFVSEEELDKDKVYDVFISFSNKEDAFVLKTLLPVLESGAHPYKCCIHYRDFVPGKLINEQVAFSVSSSRRTLVVLTNNFLESCWSKSEFRMAHTQAIEEGRARVVVVIYGDVDESKLDDELKAYLRMNTFVKWGDPWFWQKLIYALPHNKAHTFNQKHANMMLKIEQKFDVVAEYPPQSTPPILSLDAKILTSYPALSDLVPNPPKVVETQPTDSVGPLITNTTP